MAKERALWFGLFGAPAVWSLQTIIGFAVASHLCYPQALPLSHAVGGGLRTATLLVTLVGVVISVAAGFVAHSTWRSTAQETAGSHGVTRDAGEERMRFMALSGILVSALFLLAIVLAGAAILVVPPCTYGA